MDPIDTQSEIAENDPNADEQMNTEDEKENEKEDEKIFDTVETTTTKIFSIEAIHNDYFDSASKTVCEMCNYTYNTMYNKTRDRSIHWFKTHFRQKFIEEIGEKMKISFPKGGPNHLLL